MIVLTLMCVALGLYLLVADQAFVRPRPLNPTAINCFAGGFFEIQLQRSAVAVDAVPRVAQ
jgi:hypothetical protein